MSLLNLALVGIGGFVGAIARFSISKALNKSEKSIPIGTLTVNLVGSLLFGLIIGIQSNEMIILLFGTGFLGAFTTFSTLKLEMTKMSISDQTRNLRFYTIMTYGLGVSLAYLGYLIGNVLIYE